MVSLLQASFPVDREFVTESIIIKVVGHPLRIKILNELQSRGCNVSRICESLKVSQAAISHHLALLKDAGIVTCNRNGAEVFYSIECLLAKRLLSIINAKPLD